MGISLLIRGHKNNDISYSLIHMSCLLTLTYVDVSDDYSIAIAVEKVVSLRVSIDDDRHTSFREWQRGKYSLCNRQKITRERFKKLTYIIFISNTVNSVLNQEIFTAFSLLFLKRARFVC